jgi:mevalonate pyrophosphate decarboxylase
MRSLGTTFGSTVIGVVLTGLATGSGATALPSETAFEIALLVGASVSAAAAVLTACIPGSGAAETDSQVRTASPEPIIVR